MICLADAGMPADLDDDHVVHIAMTWLTRIRIKLRIWTPRAACGASLADGYRVRENPPGMPDCPRCTTVLEGNG